MATDRKRVALLVGGDSSERAVSFESGRAMANALAEEKYALTAFDIANPSTREQIPGTIHACVPVEWNQLTTMLSGGGFDVVLPALHGGWGEDGTLQSLLDVAGIPYVGSGARASVIGIDKQVCKAVMRDWGVASPRGCIVQTIEECDFVLQEIDGPFVVKPNAGGSSVGTTLLRERKRDGFADDLRNAVQMALEDNSGGALVEELIEGVEITAAVLGQGSSAQVLPLLEIVPQRGGGFFDYEAKYTQGGAQHIIPPRLPEAVIATISDWALRTHRALECRGVSRSDFIVTSEGKPHFLEINTLPGMTEMSLVPDCARAAGINFENLLQFLIEQALQ